MLRVKKIPIYANINIAVLNEADLYKYGLKISDRIKIKKDNIERIAIVDTDNTGSLVKEGEIGIFSDIKEFNEGDFVNIEPVPIPESIRYIKEKVYGNELTASEIKAIIQDIYNDKLLPHEVSMYIASITPDKMSLEEITNLTKAMIEVGRRISWPNEWTVVDKHSIGGIPNNRTTPIVVSIVAALGLKIPKTSSRAITSPAGTADVIEVLAPVDLSIEEIKRIVEKVNGCMVWGGALDISPVDDKLIKIEKSLFLDPIPQLVASVLSKKIAIGSKYVIIDIPYGPTAKVKTIEDAKILARIFKEVSNRLGLKTKVIITKGIQPIGNGIGPVLEMIDIINVLRNKGPNDLKEKGIELAGELLKMVNKGDDQVARSVLESGKAFNKFKEIIEEQGGSIEKDLESMVEKYVYKVKSPVDGYIEQINNIRISKIARLLGSPKYKGAGLYLHKKVGDYVKKGETLFEMFSPSEYKIDVALKYMNNYPPYLIREKTSKKFIVDIVQ